MRHSRLQRKNKNSRKNLPGYQPKKTTASFCKRRKNLDNVTVVSLFFFLLLSFSFEKNGGAKVSVCVCVISSYNLCARHDVIFRSCPFHVCLSLNLLSFVDLSFLPFLKVEEKTLKDVSREQL